MDNVEFMPAYQLHGRPTTGDFNHHFVYALFCKDDEGPGYIKFGRTQNPNDRLTQIRTTCPIPARMYAFIEIGPSLKVAQRIEKALFARFEDRRIRKQGEWFKFKFDNPEDKQEFNQGCREVFLKHLGSKHDWWTKVGVPALDAAERQRRKIFMSSSHGKRILRRKASDRRFREKSGILT